MSFIHIFSNAITFSFGLWDMNSECCEVICNDCLIKAWIIVKVIGSFLYCDWDLPENLYQLWPIMSSYHSKNILKIDADNFFLKMKKWIFLKLDLLEKLNFWKIILPSPPIYHDENFSEDSKIDQTFWKNWK